MSKQSGKLSQMVASPRTKRARKSSNSLAELTPRIGQRDDAVVKLLKKAGVPVTRKSYLELAHLGNPPNPVGAEEESMMPESLRTSDERPLGEGKAAGKN